MSLSVSTVDEIDLGHHASVKLGIMMINCMTSAKSVKVLVLNVKQKHYVQFALQIKNLQAALVIASHL